MARGEITIRTVGAPNLSVTALMDENGPKITGGYGGWDLVQRPRRVGLVQWNGRDPYTMTLGIVLDGFADRDEIEIEISKIERMALPYRKEPPIVEVKGSAVPHDDLKWRLNAIEYGDAIRKVNGRRTRQQMTLTLLQRVDVDRIQLSAAKTARQKKGRP